MIYVRNKFYDTGILKSAKVSKPVISIGNLTTGGTGKTPLTIFVSKYYLNIGKKVGIISRGYKRKSEEMVLVSDGKRINDNTDQSGDELVLIASELIKDHRGNFFIAAGKNRVEAAGYLINNFTPDIIILDDGFQHRKLKRDLDIVLIDSHNYQDNKFVNTFTLPSGMLRENFSSFKRADIIIQNNKNEDMKIISALENFKKEIISMRYKTEYFIDYKNCILNELNENAIVFSGLADNRSFIEMVKTGNINITGTKVFPDHHNYSESDITSLKEIYTGDSVFITTGKDFIKVKHFNDFTKNYPVYYLMMSVELGENKNALYHKLNALVN
jgi:tetraacyldisaccharide 4'-kinase